MTRTRLEELMEAVQPRYVKAKRMEKGRILDEFVSITGYHEQRHVKAQSVIYEGWTRRVIPDL